MNQLPLINTRQMSSAREMRKLRRDREVQRLRLQRKTGVDVHYPTDYNWEFNYPDESRHWTVFVGRCPMCEGTGPQRMEVLVEDSKENPVLNPKKKYRVCCVHPSCAHATPWMEHSKAAIRHWKLVAALMR